VNWGGRVPGTFSPIGVPSIVRLNWRLSIAPLETVVHLSGVPLLPPYNRYPRGSLPGVILASRAVFETTLRRMVLTTCPNVSYRAGSVIELVRSESPTNRLAGVKLRTVVGEEQHIPALLVVGPYA
jgi:hypothetical protein